MPLTPDEVRFIRQTFDLHPAGLARVLAVSPASISRWESGTSVPTGLHDEILRALQAVAVRLQRDPDRRREIGGMLALGVGAMLSDLLTHALGRRRAE